MCETICCFLGRCFCIHSYHVFCPWRSYKTSPSRIFGRGKRNMKTYLTIEHTILPLLKNAMLQEDTYNLYATDVLFTEASKWDQIQGRFIRPWNELSGLQIWIWLGTPKTLSDNNWSSFALISFRIKLDYLKKSSFAKSHKIIALWRDVVWDNSSMTSHEWTNNSIHDISCFSHLLCKKPDDNYI